MVELRLPPSVRCVVGLIPAGGTLKIGRTSVLSCLIVNESSRPPHNFATSSTLLLVASFLPESDFWLSRLFSSFTALHFLSFTLRGSLHCFTTLVESPSTFSIVSCGKE